MKQLAILLTDFNFECIGTAQTDDENVICESLKRFGAIIGNIEDEREKMVSRKRKSGGSGSEPKFLKRRTFPKRKFVGSATA